MVRKALESLLTRRALIFGGGAASAAILVAAPRLSSRRSNEPAVNGGVSVVDFGARGDGRTDDTAAFRAAANSGALYIWVPKPSLFYQITDEIVIATSGQTWKGVGASSHIKQVSTERNGFAVMGDDVALQNLRIEGPATMKGVNSFEKNNGIFATGKRNLTVTGCTIHGFGMNGVQVRNTTDTRVENNRFYGNLWVSGTGSDILFYSSVPTRAARVVGNQCLSNNSQGIFMNALGMDVDAVVSDNLCMSVDPATQKELAAAQIKRRHGIIASYVGGGPDAPVLITRNTCRNTNWTGIYSVAARPTGPITISHNFCSNNGLNEAGGLQGGIFVDSQGRDIIEYNTIENFRGQIGGAITIQSNSGRGHISCRSNKVIGSRQRGIFVASNLRHAVIASNVIKDATGFGIDVNLTPRDASVGGIVIEGNEIEAGPGAAGIRFNVGSGRVRSRIVSNTLVSAGERRSQRDLILVVGAPPIDIAGNTIQDF